MGGGKSDLTHRILLIADDLFDSMLELTRTKSRLMTRSLATHLETDSKLQSSWKERESHDMPKWSP